MKMKQTILAVLVAVCALSASAAEPYRASVRVTFASHAAIDGSLPMTFSDEPFHATVTVTWIHNVTLIQGGEELPGTPADAPELQLPANWWRRIEWELKETKGGASVAVDRTRARLLGASQDSEAPIVLRVGESASATIELDKLPQGDYIAQVRIPVTGRILQSNKTAVAVRNGNESAGVRRVYLRARMMAPGVGYEAQKEALAELTQLEPDNAANYELIADIGLYREPVDATLSNYDKAVALLRERASHSPAERNLLEAKIASIEDAKSMVLEYKSRPGQLDLTVEYDTFGTGKRYVLRERGSAKVIRSSR